MLLLQRKVRTLQGKLETQKTRIKKLEEELKTKSHDQTPSSGDQHLQSLEKEASTKDAAQVATAGRIPIDRKVRPAALASKQATLQILCCVIKKC